MKKIFLSFLCVAMVVVLASCGHQHTWQEATCTTPKTCSECGETEGEPIEHSWVDATCEKPQTCSVCGATQGEANGHAWEKATCQHPERCSICGSTRSTQLGDHECNTWSEIVDSSCSAVGYKKGTCINCGQEFTIIVDKAPHSFDEWKETKKASCVETGEKKHSCTVCGYEETEKIALLDHELDEWKLTKEATYNEKGIKEQKCLICNNTINTEEVYFVDTIKDKVSLKGDVTGLQVTDARVLFASSWGYINGQVIIEITNNSDSNVKLSKASVDLVDKDGMLVDTLDDYSINHVPVIIEVGQKGYLLCELYSSNDELDTSNGLDVKAYITVEKTNDFKSQWEFTDVNTKGNDPETIGHIRNAGKVTFTMFTVYCVYRDSTGRVVGFTAANSNNSIDPDETVSFGTYNGFPGLINSSDIADVECIGIGYLA